MNIFSSRYIDLRIFKTKDILFSEIEKVTKIFPSNKKKTFYKCHCPFHKEKTPSMKFFYNKYIGGWGYKCLGCGASGDVFTFLMKYKRIPFWEALVFLKKNYKNKIFFADKNQIKIPFKD